ncbi:MAG: C25 family cysteine peptidase [Candidatus Thermoplasmatota archaeon]
MNIFHQKRGWIPAIIFISIISATGVPFIQAQPSTMNQTTINLSYIFEQPIIHQTMMNNDILTQVIFPDTITAGNPGEPDLPVYPIRIVVPYQAQVQQITVTPRQHQELGIYDIPPVPQPMPMLSPGEKTDTLYAQKNHQIYATNAVFPGIFYQYVGEYMLCGYRILFLNLYPVQYNPVTKQTMFYQTMDVTIATTSSPLSTPILYRDGKDIDRIQNTIDNPSTLATYPKISAETSDEYDLLILTTDEFKDAFIPLQEVHNNHGTRTIIKTLTDVGGTSPEMIREYITSCYTQYHISYVLIGGDHDIIPIKKLWAQVNNGATTDHLPSDIYYACLDGQFNFDGDDKWGEPTDGDNGRDIDLLAEVYVGRASVGTITEAQNFVTKTITYMNDDQNNPDLRKIALLGEQLDSSTYGDTAMENLAASAIPKDLYILQKLYDQDHIWSKEELLEFINSNVHMINHLGHSYIYNNLKLSTTDVDSLTNEQLFFVYTQGCYPGALDLGDCIAEHFTVKTQHAAVAGVWNSRYGWYTPGQVINGPSHKYHQSFVKGLLQQNKTAFGEANHYSKEYLVNYINHNAMRWCYYETNLFGDPAVRFHIPAKVQADLEATGSITWTNVKPNQLVTNSFTLRNSGDLGTQLSWRISEYPSWGTWTFSPSNGQGLKPEDGEQTIRVSVIAPNEKNKAFTGALKVINTQNTSDYSIITITLSTPLTVSSTNPLIQRIINRLIYRFPLIEQVLGRIPALQPYLNK